MSSRTAVGGKNLRGGAPVTVQLRGTEVQGAANVVEDEAAIMQIIHKLVARDGDKMAQRMGFFKEQPGGQAPALVIPTTPPFCPSTWWSPPDDGGALTRLSKPRATCWKAGAFMPLANQIVKERRAQGSLYYYFSWGRGIPRSLGRRCAAGQRHHAAHRGEPGGIDDPAEAVSTFVANIAGWERQGFRSGGRLMTIAMETAAARRNGWTWPAAPPIRQFQSAFEADWRPAVLAPRHALALAIFICRRSRAASSLTRTYHGGDPLRRVAVELVALLRLRQPQVNSISKQGELQTRRHEDAKGR
ncbi:MAG: hypothetical protein IPM07_16385 [Anaerolineales bacterium]|nr:hypothetical protein [Anaerolineales bacterium]